MNKSVAVIIPNYNKAKWIKACIDSVVAQTYPNIEIIVVDDCSTDDSVSVINNNYAQIEFLHLYKLEKNRGVSYARNYGVEHTNADYILFLDSDDIYYNPRKIENEVRLASPKTVVFSQWVPMDIQGNILPYTKYKKNPYGDVFSISKILSTKMPTNQQLRGYMIPRELFLSVGSYDPSMNLFEDFDLQCRLGLNGSFLYSGEIGEAYRIGTGGLSATGSENAAKTIDMVQKKYYGQLSIIQKAVFVYYLHRKNNPVYYTVCSLKKLVPVRKGKKE